MVGSTLGVYSFALIFVSARTNKRHHHHALSVTLSIRNRSWISPVLSGFSSQTGCFGCNLLKTEPILHKVEVNARKKILGLSAHHKHTSSSTLSHTTHTAPPPSNPYSLTHLFAAASYNCAISCSNHWKRQAFSLDSVRTLRRLVILRTYDPDPRMQQRRRSHLFSCP
jgi:hypothetical protein